MTAVKDKPEAGHNHLRYMLSSWFDSSKDDTWANAASMVGQKKPETQEQIRSFVLEVLFCAWKMHALDPGGKEKRNRAGSSSGWVRHGVTPVSARGGGVGSNSESIDDVLLSREASLEGVRQQTRQLGGSRQCRYLRVQTTPPDDIQFGRRSPSLTTPPPTRGTIHPPPVVSAHRHHPRPSRHVLTHHKGSINKRNTGGRGGGGGGGEHTHPTNRCNTGGGNIHPAEKCNSGKNIHPKAFLAGCCRQASPESPPPPRSLVNSPLRCRSEAKARQDLAGRHKGVADRKQDTAGIYQDMAGRHQDMAGRYQDMAGRYQYMAGKDQDMAGREVLLEAKQTGRGPHRPLSEWRRVEKREWQKNLPVRARRGVRLVSRRARRERPTKPAEVLRRVTTCLDRYSHFESRQRRAMTLCRAAQLASVSARSRSDIVSAATAKAANLRNTVDLGEANRCRSAGPTLARCANGSGGVYMGRHANEDEELGWGINGGGEILCRSATGNEGRGRGFNCNEGLRREINGSIGLGRGFNCNEGLRREINGSIGLGRGVNGSERRRQERTKGGGDGEDVVFSVRTEMLGQGLSLSKYSDIEDMWI